MKFLYVLLGLVALVVVGVLALPFVLPAETIARQIETIVQQQTGRTLTIKGTPRLSLFPDLQFEARDVALSGPAGAEGAAGDFVSMGELQVELALAPLLGGDVDVERFVLVRPVIALEVDQAGRGNWDFSREADAAPAQRGGSSGKADREQGAGGAQPSVETAQPGAAQPARRIRSLRLGRIEVIDGTLSYRDQRDGTSARVEAINMELTAPGLDQPVHGEGNLEWNGVTVELVADLATPQALMEGRPATLRAQLAAKPFKAVYDGTVATGTGLALDGALDASAASLRALARWAGTPLAAGNGLEAFSVAGKLGYAGNAVSLSDARLSLDGMNAQGNVVVELGRDRPQVRASLGIDRIDVNRYLSGGGSGGGSRGSDGGGSSGASGGGGWSTAQNDFSGLGALDASLRLAASQLRYRDIEAGNSALDVTLAGGRLKAELTQLALYGGSARGTLALDGAAAPPALAVSMTAEGVDAGPLLKAAADMDWLEGSGQLALKVSSRGRSQREMIETVTGRMEVLVTDGAIRGVNIPSMMRDLGTGALSGWAGSDVQKTDFSELQASFDMQQGTAVNRDLKLIGPLVRLTGAGTVDLPEQYLDYRIEPKLVASLEGQGGAEGLAGLNVPVIVKGPWANPDIYPDIKGILEDPEAAYKQLKQVGKDLKKAIKKGKPEDLLRGLLGVPQQQQPQQEQPQQEQTQTQQQPADSAAGSAQGTQDTQETQPQGSDPAAGGTAPDPAVEPAPQEQTKDPVRQLLKGLF